MDEMFGLMMITFFFVYIIISCCGVYLTTILLNFYSEAGVRWVAVFYGLADVLLGTFTILILFNLHRQGQEITSWSALHIIVFASTS